MPKTLRKFLLALMFATGSAGAAAPAFDSFEFTVVEDPSVDSTLPPEQDAPTTTSGGFLQVVITPPPSTTYVATVVLDPPQTQVQIVDETFYSLFPQIEFLIDDEGDAAHAPLAFIANRDDANLSVINTQLNQVVATIPTGPEPVAVALETTRYAGYVVNAGAVACTVNAFSLYSPTVDLSSPTLVGAGATHAARSARWPLPKYTYVANAQDNTVSVVAGFGVLQTLDVGTEPRKIVPRPDGEGVYVLNAGNGSLSIISEPFPPSWTAAVIDTFNVAAEGEVLWDFVFAPDGRVGFTSLEQSADGSFVIRVLHTADNTFTALADTEIDQAGTLYVGPDGTLAYAPGAAAGTVTRIDITQGPAREDFAGMDVTPDGRLYVVDATNNQVQVLDAGGVPLGDPIAVGANPIAPGKFIGPVRFKEITLHDVAMDVAAGEATGFSTIAENTGSLPVTVDSTSVAGVDAQFLEVGNGQDHCSQVLLNPGEFCSIDVQFNVPAAGEYNGELHVLSEASAEPAVAHISISAAAATIKEMDPVTSCTAHCEAAGADTQPLDSGGSQGGVGAVGPLWFALLLFAPGAVLRRRDESPVSK